MIDPICKFNDSKANAINCSQFIFETTDAQATPRPANCHHVGLVLRGGGTLTVNAASTPLAAGDVYFIKKGSSFSVKRGADMTYFYIAFDGWHASELIERVGLSQQNCVFGGHGELIDFWRDCFDKAEGGNLDLFSETVLLYTVAHLAEVPKEKNELADRICEYANKHFGEASLGLARIARELGYDAKYLSAAFKAGQGISFTQYLRELRIKHAAFLFEQGVQSVKSVSMLSGFSDALYFSRTFKQQTGMSPSDYIKRVTAGRKER